MSISARQPAMPATLREMLAIDLRALAAFRVSVGAILLIDLVNRAGDLTAHYTDGGVLPRSATNVRFPVVSVHMLSGDAWFQALLFALAGVFAVMLLVGWRTRLSTIVSWALLVSLHARNPHILNGGDTLLRCLLFWSMFLPLGARWSADSVLSRFRPAFPHVSSVATLAIILQLCLMYWFTAALKTHPAWHETYTATYLALGYENYVTPFGTWLRNFPEALRLLTMGVYYFEWLGPCLIFFPYFNSTTRSVAAAAFIAMHLSFLVCMYLGLFSVVCAVAWLLVLPSEFWDWVDAGLRPMARSVSRLPAIGGWRPSAELPRLELHRVTAACVMAMVVLTLAWNVTQNGSADSRRKKLLPKPGRLVIQAARLEQRWNMFSPRPPTWSGRFEMVGQTRSGTAVDLWRGESISGDQFAPMTFDSHRWRKYLANLSRTHGKRQRSQFADWAVRTWNDRQAMGDDEVVSVEFRMHRKANVPPGQPLPEERIVSLYRKDLLVAGDGPERR